MAKKIFINISLGNKTIILDTFAIMNCSIMKKMGILIWLVSTLVCYNAIGQSNTSSKNKTVAVKKIDIGNPSLKNSSADQQLDAVNAILKYCAADAMQDFFRLYQGNIKPNIFSEEVMQKAGSFGYMFVESPESNNIMMKDWIQSINYNLKKPLLQFFNTVIITKPNKALQGGTNGITTFLFTTYENQIKTVIKNAVDATFIELAHANNTKSFFPMVQSFDFGDLDKDARPNFTSFIYKQLQARFTMEEFLLRDNPPVANNANVMKIFGGNGN
jgi:hypothetical protein